GTGRRCPGRAGRIRDRAPREPTWTVATFCRAPLDSASGNGKERLHQAAMILRPTSPTLARAFIAVAGCAQSDPVASPCHDIPTNGCPLYGDGIDCTDPWCAAMYDCIDGEFTLDHACPGFTGCDAGAPAPIPDAATCDLTGVDAPAGASG